MSKELAIKTVKTLRKFVDDNGVQMDGTECTSRLELATGSSESDLIIRTNRLALAVKAVGTKEQSKSYSKRFPQIMQDSRIA